LEGVIFLLDDAEQEFNAESNAYFRTPNGAKLNSYSLYGGIIYWMMDGDALNDIILFNQCNTT
jgi:hypothetical protein